ncbi:MAG TPA: SRPBCC domain-containing protein [Methylomirabilota bacterium]
MTASDREIVTTRVLAWPRERVVRAWTDPDHLARWWGPKGFTNTFQEFDLRPGGRGQFVMHGPNGADYPNQSVKAAVDPKNLFRLNQNIVPAA